MGLFTPRGVKKIARVALLIAALSTACQKRSEQFIKLVQPGDRAAATLLIKEPKQEKLWKNVAYDLDRFNFYFGRFKTNNLGGIKSRPFYMVISENRELDKLMKNLRELKVRTVQALKDAGLTNTADEINNNVIRAEQDMDTTLANYITEQTNRWLPTLARNKIAARRQLEHWYIIENLQLLLRAARNVGFNKAAVSASNALINFRAAMK